jgi:hypothetical protein
MKAEQRKELETNSLILTYQRLRQKMSGRAIYYVVGFLILLAAGILIYRYYTSESQKARDAGLQQLEEANTEEKLKEGMEAHRGTPLGIQFKINLARLLLNDRGLPKLGTERTTDRNEAATKVQQGRDYFIELTKDLNEKEQPALLQECWASAAQGEESLIGVPATEGGTDYRGNIDKAIEYYEKASAIFADKDFSKKYKERADMLKANKDKVVADYRAIYKPREMAFPPSGPELPPLGPKGDFPPPPIPGLEPKKGPDGPNLVIPPLPGEPKKEPEAKKEPAPTKSPDPKKEPEAKKEPEPTKPEPATTDPKAK